MTDQSNTPATPPEREIVYSGLRAYVRRRGGYSRYPAADKPESGPEPHPEPQPESEPEPEAAEAAGAPAIPERVRDDDGAGRDDAHDPRRLSHPAGSGWIPAGRDIGLPGEAPGERPLSAHPGGKPVPTFPDGPMHSFASGDFSDPPLLFRGGDRGVVADARASGEGAHHPQTPSSKEEGAFPGSPQIQFTPARRVLFCERLSQSGNVRLACERAGISAPTAYKARRRDPLFARAWDEALALARCHAEAVLADRALAGVDEPVFHRGEEVARRRRYDTRLLLAHLARLDAHCARMEEQGPADFDRLLGELGGLLDPGESSYAREEFVADVVADAEFEARCEPECPMGEGEEEEDEEEGEDEGGEEAWDGEEEEWEGTEADRIVHATRTARAGAEAEWDEALAQLRGEVDALVAEEEREACADRLEAPAFAGAREGGAATLAPLPQAGGVGGGRSGPRP